MTAAHVKSVIGHGSRRLGSAKLKRLTEADADSITTSRRELRHPRSFHRRTETNKIVNLLACSV